MLLKLINGWTNWQDFLNWFNNLGVIGQFIFTILLITFAVSITILVCIGVFYLLKYLFLGIYYLLKGLFKGIYLLFKKLHEGLVSLYKILFKRDDDSVDKSCDSEQIIMEKTIEKEPISKTLVEMPREIDDSLENVEGTNFAYCPECGMKFTDKMNDHLKLNGRTYCVNCGQGFNIQQYINLSSTES
jgi:hypothetical protein